MYNILYKRIVKKRKSNFFFQNLKKLNNDVNALSI